MAGDEFILGIIASIIAAYVWDKVYSRIPYSNKFGSIDIQGVWVGKIKYNHKPGRSGYNIFKLVENKGNIRAYIEHYTIFEDQTSKYSRIRGIGIYSAPIVTLAYQFDKKVLNQTGTFIARTYSDGGIGDTLHATFSQYMDGKHENGTNVRLLSEDYVLYRTKMPIIAQIRVLFGLTFFKNGESVAKHFQYSTDDLQITDTEKSC